MAPGRNDQSSAEVAGTRPPERSLEDIARRLEEMQRELDERLPVHPGDAEPHPDRQ